MSDAKRFKRDVTLLEHLPNELLAEIFSYLNGVDTVYACSHLNTRFQGLLYHYVNVFNFESVSKAKFHYVTDCQDIRRWRSLYLSNGDDTPGQIRLFCQLYPPAKYINKLQSLTALHMEPKYAQEFLSQITSFSHLVSLSIGKICGFNMPIIELPSLKRLTLTSCKDTKWIMNFHCLEDLQYTIENDCYHHQSLIFPTTLKRLRLFYENRRDGTVLQTLLPRMSKLTTLALYDSGEYSPVPNGKFWEELIVSSLPLLNTFQFYFPFYHYTNSTETLQEVIASFSTAFYLYEKRWFIRFDYERNGSAMHALLYSLPFAFSYMAINTCSFDTSISTLPFIDFKETKSNYYTKVNTIVFNKKCKQPHLGFLECNIIRLVLHTDLPKSWIYLLTKLRHLDIRTDVKMSSYDFNFLLKHAPNLQSLNISVVKLKDLTDQFSNQSVCHYLSERIQSLTITEHYSYSIHLGIVSVRLLNSLVRLFSTKCQHLSLRLRAHPTTVRPILRRMRQLRSLHIQWRFARFDVEDTISSWLRQQSTDPKSVDFVHTKDEKDLFVWFGNRL